MYGRAFLGAIAAVIGAVVYTVALQNQTLPYEHVQGKNNTVLFITAEPRGFCNVHLATAYSLLQNHPHINIHYASFADVAGRLRHIVEVATDRGAESAHTVFHTLQSPGYVEALFRVKQGLHGIRHEPGAQGIDRLAEVMPAALAPWTNEEYWHLYGSLTSVIDEVDPAVVVVDTFFHPGIDATRDKQRLHALITPNLFADLLPAQQPAWTLLWKYPAMGSGFPYPVPWRLIPANVHMSIKMIRAVMRLPEIHAKQAWLKAKGIATPINFMGIYKPYMPWLTQTLPGAHLPMVRIPENVTRTGPINLAGLEEETASGKALLEWVQRKKTVMIALGSGFKFNEDAARNMTQAMESILTTTSDLQVLWKMEKSGSFDTSFVDHAVEQFPDRFRIEKWLDVELPTLLQSGHIAAFVHHGGAGCYHDALG
jgi:hypothetical protein